MKVSKRKLIVLICILVFCIAIVCLLAYKTTEDFFPRPKKITCKYGSIEIELSDEQIEVVYQKFAQMTAIPYKGWQYSRASNEHALIDFYASYYEFKETVASLK